MKHMLEKARTFFEKASPEEKQGLAIRDAGDGIGDSSRGFQRVEGGKKGAHEVGCIIMKDKDISIDSKENWCRQ